MKNEEDYLKEETIKDDSQYESNSAEFQKQKKPSKVKFIEHCFAIYLILWLVNFLILLFVPSCGLFSICHPDGLRIFLINAIILFWLGVIGSILIIVASIISTISKHK